MWDSKKDLIIKLYEKDEWPVKQVIKKIRSHNFNPSESQLRSRLKKWRVTKSSRRQGRGKGVDRSANHTTEASSEVHSGITRHVQRQLRSLIPAATLILKYFQLVALSSFLITLSPYLPQPDSFQWMADSSHWLPLENRTQSFAAPLQAPVPFSPPMYQQMPVIPHHIRSDWHPTPECLPDNPVSGLYFMGYPAWQ
ncbi:hypothetical protein ETB97_009017 [Aspergillus alliaceus]|uniref:Clr5 domain-containing protein n=1 Tax=Petromyces alliaceus TaxID=209559 RepID=A0A8H6EAL6_PETAA|nr:hypothetical protein ETB97_009017 [Aspergillus burnettii]